MKKHSISNKNSLLRKLHTESVTHCAKADSGITLIALVVTIIVNLLSYDKKVKYSI